MAKGEWTATTQFINSALRILEREQPMTIRQLFYRLVSIGEIQNSLGCYQRVSRVMTKAREDNRCPWNWIVDRSRPAYQPSVWANPSGYAEAVKRSYRKDYWASQPVHVEVWTEKDAIIGAIEEVTEEFGVTVRVYRGFQSTTRVKEIASILRLTGKPNKVFYLGDHDPSGCCIEDEGYGRLGKHGSGDFELERLAIHKEDIKAFGLPPLRVKQTDSRTRGFLREHGPDCVELDALPPTELRRRLRDAITAAIDADKWNRAIQVEKAELASIIETVNKWPTLEAAGGQGA